MTAKQTAIQYAGLVADDFATFLRALKGSSDSVFDEGLPVFMSRLAELQVRVDALADLLDATPLDFKEECEGGLRIVGDEECD